MAGASSDAAPAGVCAVQSASVSGLCDFHQGLWQAGLQNEAYATVG